MSKLKIYANHVSGNCWKVKWTADYLRIESEWIEVGNALTLADIALVAHTRVAPEGRFSPLEPYPAIRRWIAGIERELDVNLIEAA